jgi:flagellar capping protein FliD
LIKIQQKTSKVVENSVKDQQGAINILIDNLRKKLTKTARKEEILISELSDDAPERKTVTDRIIKRSKETVEKLTKVQDELKEKKEKISKDTAGLKDDIKGMTEKLSAIQAKIMTS